MARQWEAEQTVEAQDVLSLINAQFPELQANTARLLGVGWDNTAYLVNDALVFRFPRRQIAVPMLRSEACILSKIADYLPVPVPNPAWKGLPDGGYPWPFLGYRLLPGMTACQVGLTEDHRKALAVPIAKFLKALHSIPLSVGQSCHLSGDILGRLNSSRLIGLIEQNLRELETLGLAEGLGELRTLINAAEFRAPQSSVLVHGDFYIRHLLLNDQHQLAGVIDWGDVHIGDSAVDLSIAHSLLPRSAHESFRAAYGEIAEDTWSLARLRAIYSNCILAVYGYHSKDHALQREGLHALRQIAC